MYHRRKKEVDDEDELFPGHCHLSVVELQRLSENNALAFTTHQLTHLQHSQFTPSRSDTIHFTDNVTNFGIKYRKSQSQLCHKQRQKITRNTLDCDQSIITPRALFSPTYLLNLVKPEIASFDPPTPKTPP